MISNIIAKTLLILFLIAAPFLLIGFGKEFWNILSNLTIRSPKVIAFIIGIISFFPVLFFFKRYFESVWQYLTTLEHECTHAIVGLMFGKIPVGMRVSAWEGGEVILRGGTNVWILLAPYFLPTISLVTILAGWIFSVFDSNYFIGILGWTVAFHLVTNWKETSFRQTDLQQTGYLTSILVLPVANLLTYGTILSLVFGGIKTLQNFWLDGVKNSWTTFFQIFR